MARMTTGEAELISDTTAVGRAASAGARALRGAFASMADFLLPPLRIACRTRTLGHGLLCGDCFARIDFIVPPVCTRLGVPLPYDTGEPTLSAAAIADPPVYDRARRGALLLDRARADPKLQIWGSPRGSAAVRPLARGLPGPSSSPMPI
jgi:hypothetical protein